MGHFPLDIIGWNIEMKIFLRTNVMIANICRKLIIIYYSKALGSCRHYYLHFANGEAKAQSSWTACPRSHIYRGLSWDLGHWGYIPGSWSRSVWSMTLPHFMILVLIWHSLFVHSCVNSTNENYLEDEGVLVPWETMAGLWISLGNVFQR